MKRLVLPQGWDPKRLKANRFGFVNLAGRVVSRARQLIIRLSGGHPAYELLIEVRRRLRDLFEPSQVSPSGSCAALTPLGAN